VSISSQICKFGVYVCVCPGITHTIMHHICRTWRALAILNWILNMDNHFYPTNSWWPFFLQPAKVFFLKLCRCAARLLTHTLFCA